MYGSDFRIEIGDTDHSEKITHGNLTQLLKSTNDDAHRRLEQTVNIMHPGMTLTDYAILVQRFYSFIKPWEDQVRSMLPEALIPLFANRYKAAWIQQDLDGLRCLTQSEALLSTQPTWVSCKHLPDMSTTARLLGSAYVLEGSSLGGRIISSHLQQHFGSHCIPPHRYFQGYGNRTGSMWKTFLATLTASIPKEDFADALDASAQTFAGLTHWFSGTNAQPIQCHE